MRVPLSVCLAFAFACGGLGGPGEKKIPTPWSRREGSTEVVGSAPIEEERGDAAAEEEAGAAPEAVQEQAAAVPAGAPPVEETYEAMALGGDFACPAGTEFADQRELEGTVFCTLKDGRRHGPWLRFHSNGRPAECGPYVAGRRHGLFVRWEANGTREGAYRYRDGQPVGGKVQE